jgi:serine/threonine protein kinase
MHDNILPYFECFINEEQLWIVTVPSKKGTCKTILKNEFPNGLTSALCAFVLKGVLKAVCYLHSQRMIHNDIRAGAFFIT